MQDSTATHRSITLIALIKQELLTGRKYQKIFGLILKELDKCQKLLEFVHGGINPSNIFVEELEGGEQRIRFGPPNPPSDSDSTENAAIYKEPGNPRDQEADTYAIGYVFLFLLGCKEPFNAKRYQIEPPSLSKLITDLTCSRENRLTPAKALESDFFEEKHPRINFEILPLAQSQTDSGEDARMEMKLKDEMEMRPKDETEMRLEDETEMRPKDEMEKRLEADKKFMEDLHAKNSDNRIQCYEKLLCAIKGEERKTIEDEKALQEMDELAEESLSTAVIFQSFKRYDDAKYCYNRCIHAFNWIIRQSSDETLTERASKLRKVAEGNINELINRVYK